MPLIALVYFRISPLLGIHRCHTAISAHHNNPWSVHLFLLSPLTFLCPKTFLPDREIQKRMLKSSIVKILQTKNALVLLLSPLWLEWEIGVSWLIFHDDLTGHFNYTLLSLGWSFAGKYVKTTGVTVGRQQSGSCL